MAVRFARFCVIRISLFLASAAFLALCLRGVLKSAFLYNVQINSVILGSLLCGVAYVYLVVFRFDQELARLQRFDVLPKPELEKLRLLRPLTLCISKTNKLVPQAKMQTALTCIERRIDEATALPKYIASALVFLGLLGTFWGLSTTIGNVAGIIDNLGLEQSDAAASFMHLKEGLKMPLAGMGIAFGCSLFGLAGSLILGFLSINLRQTAADFLSRVEEWAARHTIGFGAVDEATGYHGQVFSMALLEKTIETIYAFQAQIKSWDGNLADTLNLQRELAAKTARMCDAVTALAAGQAGLQNMAGELAALNASVGAIAGALAANRDHIVESLGKDIRLVTKVLSTLAEDQK